MCKQLLFDQFAVLRTKMQGWIHRTITSKWRIEWIHEILCYSTMMDEPGDYKHVTKMTKRTHEAAEWSRMVMDGKSEYLELMSRAM